MTKTHHREDLVIALAELFGWPNHHEGWTEWDVARKAFKAAESELSCPDTCDTSCRCYQEGQQSHNHCGCDHPNCDCPCFQDGYRDGLEAQGERVG